MAYDANVIIIRNKAKHLLGPEPELRRLDGSALWVSENGKYVVVALLGDQCFVALLGREGEDVVVEEGFEFYPAGKALVVWRREIVKGIANLRGRRGQLLLLLGAGIG
jgi:hypothetical protein